ncbi:XRE family transcriptional regulator [Arthrobacter cheniae]|uniref:XRE family transcriptional regulator n=1 Tax=Arthrobacter cheniae TaxID=1258888 RepID=A0A3A5M9F4_9MICC|nr:XRE family transcriptional regulator [Arthrobacter cheniae]RJT75741.1 XRE family transcriptional regulator [Arthrobacter cheniae]
MDEKAAVLATAIGSRVKDERLNRRLTLDQLAEATGVSRRMIVSIEQGATNPSVGTLLKISDALGVGLPELVAPPRSSPVSVIRSGEGAALWTGDLGGFGVLVAGTRSPNVLELWDWTLEVQEQHVSEAHSAGTMELLQVQQGTITITVAGEPFTLGEGDALTFPGDVNHSYVNHSETKARFLLAVFEPGVGFTQKEGTHD